MEVGGGVHMHVAPKRIFSLEGRKRSLAVARGCKRRAPLEVVWARAVLKFAQQLVGVLRCRGGAFACLG